MSGLKEQRTEKDPQMCRCTSDVHVHEQNKRRTCADADVHQHRIGSFLHALWPGQIFQIPSFLSTLFLSFLFLSFHTALYHTALKMYPEPCAVPYMYITARDIVVQQVRGPRSTSRGPWPPRLQSVACGRDPISSAR